MAQRLDRRMLVLRAVVEDYIRTQEPVGSASVARSHRLDVSSATVRNDMAALEEGGYLTQPHTSAGRVPTEKGYRYFVDRLSTAVPLSRAQRHAIEEFLSGTASLDETLRRAARLLAQITGQVAVIAGPSLSRSSLRHLEIVPVGLRTLLVIVITQAGKVEQRTVPVETSPDPDDLRRVASAVNLGFVGQRMHDIGGFLSALGGSREFHELTPLLDALATALDRMDADDESDNLYTAGAARLAHRGQAGMEDLGPLLDALEEQVVLMRLMESLAVTGRSDRRNPGVGIAIGSETHTPGLLHSAVITSGYGDGESDGAGLPADGAAQDREGPDGDKAPAPGKARPDGDAPLAFVGAIGPTHMDYGGTIAAVRAVASYLGGIIARGDDGYD